MPASPAIRAENPGSRLYIANAWRIGGNAQTSYLNGVGTGKAPPIIVATGSTAGLASPLTITVLTPGPLGTAVLVVDGLGSFTTAPSDATFGRSLSGVTGFGQAPAVVLQGNCSVTLFLQAGTYDTSNVWTFNFGNTITPLMMAVGMAPIDIVQLTQTLTDSVLARVHTTGNGSSAQMTTPTNPWDGMRIGIMDADGNAFAANGGITVLSNGSQKIQHPYNLSTIGASLQIVIPYQTVEWAWDASLGFWRVVSDNMAGELPSIAPATSGTVVVNTKAWLKCSPSGAMTVKLPGSQAGITPTEGMRVRISDVSGGATAHHITVESTQAAWQIEALPYTGGGTGGTASVDTNYEDVTFVADTVAKVWKISALVTGLWGG